MKNVSQMYIHLVDNFCQIFNRWKKKIITK